LGRYPQPFSWGKPHQHGTQELEGLKRNSYLIIFHEILQAEIKQQRILSKQGKHMFPQA